MNVFIAIAAPLVWLLYFRERGEFAVPQPAIWAAIVVGGIACYPAFLIQTFLHTSPAVSFGWFFDLGLVKTLTLDGRYAHTAVPGIIYGGVIEETVKFIGTLAVFYLLRASLRPIDLAIIGLAVGCGFAIVENVYHYVNNIDWFRIALIRSFDGGHVSRGAIMGSLLALGYLRRKSFLMLALALMVPALLHAAQNHALTMNAVGGDAGVLARIAFIAVAVMATLLALLLIHYVRQRPGNPAGLFSPTQSPSLRVWFWGIAALCWGLSGFLFVSFDRGGRLGESMVVGIMALFTCVLFGLHSVRRARMPLNGAARNDDVAV